MTDQEPDVEKFVQFLKAAQAGQESGSTPPPKAKASSPTINEYVQAFAIAYSEWDEKKKRDFILSITVLGMSLWSKHRVRQALRALGMDKKTARLVSLGALWGTWAIAANAITGVEYGRYLAESRLYPDNRFEDEKPPTTI